MLDLGPLASPALAIPWKEGQVLERQPSTFPWPLKSLPDFAYLWLLPGPDAPCPLLSSLLLPQLAAAAGRWVM